LTLPLALKAIRSSIGTKGNTGYDMQNAGITAYFKHSFSQSKELSIDADLLHYEIDNTQMFENEGQLPVSYYEASKGTLPATLKIRSAKADYVWKFAKESQVDVGIKTANTQTNNLAEYAYKYGSSAWHTDAGKSNHFLYDENIHAAYAGLQLQPMPAFSKNLPGGVTRQVFALKTPAIQLLKRAME